MRLVNVLKAAAEGYGPEKRVILLHGPVGSSKSTIARLLKKGVEHYSRTPDGALYTFDWVNLQGHGLAGGGRAFPSPMHEEPLRLIPPSGARRRSRARLSATTSSGARRGRPRPGEPLHLQEADGAYEGDWGKVIANTSACAASC
jgi:serine protein kinase